ncbi:helix-turn-helix transcriptional regulator [Nonomuraea fuscirosea]|uniref:helix-turn-helix domain-containing protein n=1 Tax=Nonomuraea fuscirosea TaxID=1291556 RepID=UPI002DD89CC3|nr:helix-turn-helix transcriptional regulator [Nonomuraea fuscirosea]WSA51396.1 helix-turn-helix transcriptional regulator [Nonomuraea fuscirosea]
MSQTEVTERTGIAQLTINDFEGARAVPSAETLKAQSDVYQLSLDEWSLLEVARAEIR